MTEAGTTLESGIKQVATAGTRVRLTTVSEYSAKAVMIQALASNEGLIVVGDKTVVAAAGSHATPTRNGIALAAKETIAIDVVDPSAIWLDTDKSGDAIAYVVLRA